MKKFLYILFAVILTLGLSSCGGGESSEEFDAKLLYGRWQEGSVFERYDSTGMGATWDVSDDVSEEEAMHFNWSLEGSTMIHEYIGTVVIVPKVYTINTLNESQLTYSDDYGKTHSFSKVN